ncbi:MAG: formylglycine-generating enzyme family protein [Kiritimatiellae bacterium]|nr:formylglycine-generating enzyme family protein [Kiritimatiellia bacterium]
MKTILHTFALLGAAAAFGNLADPQISNFSVRQDPSRVLHVAYTLDEPAYITMEILTNGVSIGSENIKLVTGDVNKLVPVGNHIIEWNARKSWPDHRIDTPSFSVEITAWAADNPPDVLDIDIVNGTHAYYQSVDALPGGGLTNDIYRTTHLVMKKVYAAGKTFMMGSPTNESPYRATSEVLHAVSLTNDYYLAIYETTRRQFALMGCQERTDPSAVWPEPYGSDDPLQCPVVYITYNKLRGSAPTIDWPTTGAAVGGYLATIRTATGLALDIPTEAQWEFACRAGTTTALWSGKGNADKYGNNDVAAIAWYAYNSTLVNNVATEFHAVGADNTKNPWGFYDMYGNAVEWVLDWNGAYDTSVSPTIEPQGPATGTSRVHRGGSFKSFAPDTRSAARGSNNPVDGVERHGFRLCLPLSQNGTQLTTAAASASSGVSEPFAFVSRDHIAEGSIPMTFSTFEPATMIYLR